MTHRITNEEGYVIPLRDVSWIRPGLMVTTLKEPAEIGVVLRRVYGYAWRVHWLNLFGIPKESIVHAIKLRRA